MNGLHERPFARTLAMEIFERVTELPMLNPENNG